MPTRWWHFFLHGQSAFLLKLALFFRRRQGHRVMVVTDVPYYLAEEAFLPDRPPPAPLALPLAMSAVVCAATGAAFAASLIRGWPEIAVEVLGIAFVITLAALAFLLLVRAVVSGR